MKAEPRSAVQSNPSTHSHELRATGKAHGLVRRLQEDTFNGASAEKHRARFEEGMIETSVADASVPNDSSQIEATDSTMTEEPAGSPLTLDPIEFDTVLLEVVDFTGAAGTQRYGDQKARYVFGKSGQNVDWTV